MKLKEGMYIRTKLNDFCNMVAIRKIDEIDDDGSFWIDDYIIDTFGDEQNKLSEEDVDKVSDNIIDLIEIGDYVNGFPVIHNAKEHGGNIVIVINGNAYTEENIKSVVTKEQFESIKYEVE